MKGKPKFDKNKCLKCKYHIERLGGYHAKRVGREVSVMCNYLGATGHSCLTLDDNGVKIDRRGEDHKDCKLYQKGKMLKSLD